jgi:hypothetical protein
MDNFVRKGHEGVKFFVGPEVEKTPADGKKTLFVVGLQDTAKVEKLARENKTPHIFLSANRSFDSVEKVNGVYKVGNTLASDWEKQIHYLLDKGFTVSLDYPAHKHVYVLEILNRGIWQSRNFIPILSVAIPHVNTSSINLTVKIDDSNFMATNPGVWCMNHTEVTDSNRFTSWHEYADDLPLVDEEAIAVESEVKNDSSLGLDPTPTTALKPDENETTIPSIAITDPVSAAEAYAAGTTEDPLGKEASKKKVTKAKT